jgi:hypothetical protein
MYFLKSDNCGHYNEVKTEYLTFCKSCNYAFLDNKDIAAIEINKF